MRWAILKVGFDALIGKYFDRYFKMKRLRNERGQGTVELILVMIVSVLIIFGLIAKFNEAFRDFLDEYFVDYVSCLLEVGELPIVFGGEGSSICELPEFEGPNYRSISTGGGRQNAEDGDDSGPNRQSQVRQSNNNRSSGGPRGGGRGGRVGRFQPLGTAKRVPPSGATIRAVKKAEGFGGDEFNRSTRIKTNMKIPKVQRRFAASGPATGSLNKDKGRPKRISVGVDEGDTGRPKRMRLKPPKPGDKTPPPEDEPFSFGNLLKWLIIAAIIIALFVLIGGQMLQVAKSWEK